MENRLIKMQECIEAIETMMDELIKCGIKVNGNSLQGIYREFAITLLGETCSFARGLTDQGSAIKVRSVVTGVDGKGQSMVDHITMGNKDMMRVVVVALDRQGNMEGIYSASRELIAENGTTQKKGNHMVGLPKFRSYASKLF